MHSNVYIYMYKIACELAHITIPLEQKHISIPQFFQYKSTKWKQTKDVTDRGQAYRTAMYCIANGQTDASVLENKKQKTKKKNKNKKNSSAMLANHFWDIGSWRNLHINT
jgi:peptide methionine sulfoxide reductase MsrA